MGRAVVLASVLALVVGACGGSGNRAAESSAVSTIESPGQPIVIRTRMVIAATERAEPIASGEVLDGSTLGGSAFCAGGTIADTHANKDPAMEPYGLIDRTITCPGGTVRMGLTPDQMQDLTQTGSWTIVSGTGAFAGLRGSGKMEIAYDPDDDSLGRETLTGSATR